MPPTIQNEVYANYLRNMDGMVINTEVIFGLFYGIVNDFTDICTGTVQTRDRTSWRHCTYTLPQRWWSCRLETLERRLIERDTGSVSMIDIDHRACLTSSRGDYSRVASFHLLKCGYSLRAVFIPERRLVYGIYIPHVDASKMCVSVNLST